MSVPPSLLPIVMFAACIRCCFLCMETAPELMPIGERDAKAAFDLTQNGMKRIPTMFTLPGVYTDSCASKGSVS